MAQLFPQRHHSPDRWLRRLDRAADNMNPFLIVLAIGLAILNLTSLAVLASRLVIHRDMLSLSACPVALVSGPAAHRRSTGSGALIRRRPERGRRDRLDGEKTVRPGTGVPAPHNF